METSIRYTTNELENSIDYLEKAAYYFENTEEKHRFKWLMISLHGALYGFGVCAIKGTSSSLRVLDEPTNKQIRDMLPFLRERYLGIEDPIPRDHEEVLSDEHMLTVMRTLIKNNLNKIWEILDKCENPVYMLQNTESKVLIRTPKQKLAIEKMINYRNDLVHFKPMAYGITGDYDNDIILPVVEVIEFLALESNNVIYYQEEIRDRVNKTIKFFK